MLNPQNQYEHFVERFDAAVDCALRKKGRTGRVSAGVQSETAPPRAVFLMGHEPTIDPRIEWMAAGLAQDFDVCEIGTYGYEIDGRQPTCERLSKRRVRIRVERSRHDMDWVPTPETLGGGSSIGIQTLTMLYQLMELSPQSLAKRIGALDATDSDLDRFRSLCRHYVDTNGALLQAARLTGEFDLVVATDLETLPAAIALGHEHNAQVLFDAHEYWPYAYPSFRHWEVSFGEELSGIWRNPRTSASPFRRIWQN